MAVLPDFDYVRGLPDPAPNWRWVVKMPILPGYNSGSMRVPSPESLHGYRIGPGPGGRKDGQYLSSPVLPVGIVDSIDFIKQNIDADERFGAAAKLRYPRFLSTPTVSITFYEDVSYGTSQYIGHWSNLVVDSDHNYNLPSEYKKDISLFAFDIVSNTDPVFWGILRGCWPMSPGTYSYNNGGSDKVTFVTEFAVDETPSFSAGAGRMGGSFGQNLQSIIGQFADFDASLTNGVPFRNGRIA